MRFHELVSPQFLQQDMVLCQLLINFVGGCCTEFGGCNTKTLYTADLLSICPCEYAVSVMASFTYAFSISLY